MGDCDQSGRNHKLRKLSDLRAAVPFVSQSALASILKFVTKEGVPTLTQPKHVREARTNLLESFCMYGPLFVESSVVGLDGNCQSLLFANFLTYLQGAFNQGGAFQQYIAALHQKVPSSANKPWRLLVYTDECHPGNQLSSGSRKCWCIYVSFLEFHSFLAKENLWFCLLVKRSTAMSTIAAGISQVVKVLLEWLFQNPFCNPQNGLLLKCGEQRLRLYFSLGGFIQDGAAQRGVWCSRQDSGSRPCSLCSNIFVVKEWVDEEEPVKVLAQYTKLKDCVLANDIDIVQSWERMAVRAAHESKTKFKQWQQACEISFSPHALMASSVLKNMSLLKPVTGYGFDWMHALCSAGVLNYTIFAVLAALQEAGLDVWAQLGDFMQVWCLPAAQAASGLHTVFDSKSVTSYKKAGCLKCSASSILAMLKPLQYFIEVMCMPNLCPMQCQCLLAWVQVVDFLSCHGTMKQPTPETLLLLVEKALQSSIDSGHESLFRPKHHWTIHMPACLAHWGYLPSCWAMERKHKTVRKFGGNIMNTSQYEQSLLSEVVREHVFELDKEDLVEAAHLVNPVPASKKMLQLLVESGICLPGATALASRTAKLASGVVVTVGDFVFVAPRVSPATFPYHCGKVECLFQLANLQICLLQMQKFVCQKTKSSLATKWTCAEHMELVHLNAIIAPVSFSKGNGKEIICLTPAAAMSFEQ